MKNFFMRFAGIVLLATLGSVVSAQATTNYTNSVLNGCYSFLGTSVETTMNRADVGTLCFDGGVQIVGGANNSGYVRNTNGGLAIVPGPGGNYQLYNAPGDGMGQLIVATVGNVNYGSDEFSIFKTSSGVAAGYRFERVKPYGSPVNTIGGVAQFQGPGNTVYTNSVLNGCYAFLQTSVDTSPNRDNVGTLCFDGAGNIVVTGPPPPDSSGNLRITAGAIHFCNATAGTYAVTNTPGDGMGTFTLAGNCPFNSPAYFSINRVNGGLAGGFQYEAVSNNGVRVVGGDAVYQGP